MNFTKKLDRAVQWAGEKMGSESKTAMSDDFKNLETEMALRYEGMERLQKSMNAYVKWLGRRGEMFEDKEKGLPAAYLGRTMVGHGEEFEHDSTFGNCMIEMGRANQEIAGIQETYVQEATSTWLESLERSLAMMREFQAARKKLENRRLAYDASLTKMQKAKREDFRLEEELRAAKAKYEEASEDVLRRMQDIKDAEADSVRDLTQFLDSELDYHERCAEELRRIRSNWPGGAASGSNGSVNGGGAMKRRSTNGSRTSAARGCAERTTRPISRYESLESEPDPESQPQPVRTAIRSYPPRSSGPVQQPELPGRPPMSRTSTYGSGSISMSSGRVSGPDTPTSSLGFKQVLPNVGALRGQLRPVTRSPSGVQNGRDDVFGDQDEHDRTSGSGSPESGDRNAVPSTNIGSRSRTTGNFVTGTSGVRKAPPPPPSRAKKPAPPVPAKREMGY